MHEAELPHDTKRKDDSCSRMSVDDFLGGGFMGSGDDGSGDGNGANVRFYS